MNARATKINSILDAIKTHPYLTKKQKDEMREHYGASVDSAVKTAFAKATKDYEAQLSAQSLMILYLHFGFRKKELMKFAKHFNTEMQKYAEFLDGAASVGDGAYSDLKSLYPDCDDWICKEYQRR